MQNRLRTTLSRTIAAVTRENGGAAFQVKTHEFLPAMDMWSFPKYPGKTVILPADCDLEAELSNFIANNEQFLHEPDCWLGTWIHPGTRAFYLDIATGCTRLEEAIQQARAASQRDGRRIVAIFNAKRGQTVYL